MQSMKSWQMGGIPLLLLPPLPLPEPEQAPPSH
jgi:hypothetical protein